MRLTKSLLCAASVLSLAAGTAFAGQDSTVEGSVETSPPESLSEMNESAMNGSELSASDTEPSESSEMPG